MQTAIIAKNLRAQRGLINPVAADRLEQLDLDKTALEVLLFIRRKYRASLADVALAFPASDPSAPIQLKQLCDQGYISKRTPKQDIAGAGYIYTPISI